MHPLFQHKQTTHKKYVKENPSMVQLFRTLRLKAAEVLFEGVCRTAKLQKSQVAMLPCLRSVLLLPPHSYHNLTKARKRE